MTTSFFSNLDPADEYWLRFNFERSMTDPFPELPRRVLYVDVTKPWSPCRAATKPVPVTKIPVTKIASVTKTRGRPAKSDKPMTAAERMRLYRAPKKQSSS